MAVGPHSQGGGKLALDTPNVMAEATGNPIAAIIRGSRGSTQIIDLKQVSWRGFLRLIRS
jgi:hypothetical protein